MAPRLNDRKHDYVNNMIALVMGTQSDHIQFANSDSNVSVYGVSGERVILRNRRQHGKKPGAPPVLERANQHNPAMLFLAQALGP